MLYQQGDVLLTKVDIIPDGAEQVSKTDGRYVIAEGEATGHCHAVTEEIELFKENGRLYINSRKPFTIVHEEHKPVTIPKGVFAVSKVKEYDHFQEEVREVRD